MRARTPACSRGFHFTCANSRALANEHHPTEESRLMQLESLKMFVDVVETGSFSRAAQLNHVTQSAVSQQIRALENRYEQRLLSRSARQVTPTPAGERLFRGCKEILARFSEVEQEIREQATEVSGTCNVSCDLLGRVARAAHHPEGAAAHAPQGERAPQLPPQRPGLRRRDPRAPPTSGWWPTRSRARASTSCPSAKTSWRWCCRPATRWRARARWR